MTQREALIKQNLATCRKYGINPKLDEECPDDYAPTLVDKELGAALGSLLGDTFITHEDTSTEQWISIIKHLRMNGLRISDIRTGYGRPVAVEKPK